MKRRTVLGTLVALAARAAWPGIATAADPAEFSAAERRLFVDDHLATLSRAATLEYAFSHRGSLEKAFDDTVTIRVGPPGGATGRPVKGTFLSDTRRIELPELEHATGNPVILFFLERDVRDMQRRTGGQASYFRKRVRMALAESAQVEPIQLDLKGRSVSATRISIQPFTDDPLKNRFRQLADKSYVFILSQEVPGQLYRMQTLARAPQNDAPPILEENITFIGAEP